MEIKYISGSSNGLTDFLSWEGRKMDSVSDLDLALTKKFLAFLAIHLRDEQKITSLRETFYSKKREQLMQLCHEMRGHWGVEETLRKIQEQGFT